MPRTLIRPQLFLFILLAALLLAAVTRMWFSSRTRSEEIAGSVHSFATATVGTVWDYKTPAEAMPDDQLAFWVPEVQRILVAHPDDAELHAAAAVLLSEPSMLYFSELANQLAASEQANSWNFSNNFFDRINEARREYDVQGQRLAAKWIERATQLDPQAPQWWRLRAVLLTESVMSGQESQPLSENEKLVLQTARVRDPGNALYDLVELARINTQVLDVDSKANFIVGNVEAWKRAVELVKRIASADHLTVGEPALAGLVRLHQLSNHPTATTNESIRSRFLSIRVESVLAQAIRLPLRMSGVQGELPTSENREELIQLAIGITELVKERSGPIAKYSNMSAQLGELVWSAQQRYELESGHVSELTSQKLAAAKTWTGRLSQVGVKFQAEQQAAASVWHALLSAAALALTAACLGLTIVWIVLCFVAGRQWKHVRLDPRMLAILVTGIGLSGLFLGAGPAGLVSESTQHWMFTILMVIVIFSALGAMAVRMRYRLRFSIRSLLIASAVTAIFLQVIFHWQIGWSSFGLPLSVNVAPDPLLKQITDQDPQAFARLAPGYASLVKATTEWLVHRGPLWSVIVGFGITMLVAIWRKDFSLIVGQSLYASLLSMLLFATVWAWVEPRNYTASRPQQLRNELYIESVDRYYERCAEMMQ